MCMHTKDTSCAMYWGAEYVVNTSVQELTVHVLSYCAHTVHVDSWIQNMRRYDVHTYVRMYLQLKVLLLLLYSHTYLPTYVEHCVCRQHVPPVGTHTMQCTDLLEHRPFHC